VIGDNYNARSTTTKVAGQQAHFWPDLRARESMRFDGYGRTGQADEARADGGAIKGGCRRGGFSGGNTRQLELNTMGMAIDELTDEQVTDLTDYSSGT
jgi:hypothetical protein